MMNLKNFTSVQNAEQQHAKLAHIMTGHASSVMGSGEMKRKKQRRRAGHYLLYRREGRDKVWLYEHLRKDEITARLRAGWKIVA